MGARGRFAAIRSVKPRINKTLIHAREDEVCDTPLSAASAVAGAFAAAPDDPYEFF